MKVPEYRPKDKMRVTLDQILRSTEGRLGQLRERRTALDRAAEIVADPPAFEAALRGRNVAVIAEVKRRSPSAGSIRENLDPGERAARYADHGAAAISVLTDGPFFGGSVEDLRQAVVRAHVPVLLKDFVLDEVQIVEARAAGAAAVLLIVRALGSRLQPLLRFAQELRLTPLVEVHSEAELLAALDAGATVIGVNSRDLDTFTIDSAAALGIVSTVPAGCTVVAESGMSGKADVEQAAEAGADAVLIGTALSAAAHPGELLGELTQIRRRGR
jgi:indole-3-glycerol phosphate synthase